MSPDICKTDKVIRWGEGGKPWSQDAIFITFPPRPLLVTDFKGGRILETPGGGGGEEIGGDEQSN